MDDLDQILMKISQKDPIWKHLQYCLKSTTISAISVHLKITKHYSDVQSNSFISCPLFIL